MGIIGDRFPVIHSRIFSPVSDTIENMHGLKVNKNFLLRLLNSKRLVNLKHKLLEDKEIAKILARGCHCKKVRCIEDTPTHLPTYPSTTRTYVYIYY